MNSDERREARRKRREEERERRKEARNSECSLENVADLNNLYAAARKSKNGVAWKASVQRYQINVLRNCVKARKDLLEGRDIRKGFNEFELFERGKLRHIASVHFSERVIHKSLSVNALVPAMTPTFTYDNSANIKGKGTDFAIKRLKKQLATHYRKHGSGGYILLVDFENYFASIDHEFMKQVISDALTDRRVEALTHSLIDACGTAGLGLGSEPNQICAVGFPSYLDHFAAEMGCLEASGRYMDDSYYISNDKEWLNIFLEALEAKCRERGIKINKRKTKIVRLSHGFTFLKKKFSYGPSGKIVVRPCRDSITRERRKLKKQRKLVDEGLMTVDQVERSYQSWRGSMKRLDAHNTVLSMDSLYKSLFNPENASRGGRHSERI